MPYPLPLTRTEAYLAYKAGVIQQSDLKPSLAVPRNGIDAWLAYWTGLAADYPKREDGTPHILQEEEAYIAYLCGVINEYPEKCLRRVGAYLRYLISARWGRPDHPLNREELYLSLIKTQFIPSGDPSSDITIDGTTKAPFQDVKMYGDTAQATYTGKNLFNSSVYVSVQGYNARRTLGNDGSITWVNTTSDSYFPWIYSDSMFGNNAIRSATIPVQPSTQYTVSLKKTTATAVGLYVYEGDSDYVGIKNTYTEIRGDASYTFTTSETTRYVILRFAKWASQETDVLSEIQLEAGSTASSYEPFVGGQPSPNPDYPQAIQTVTGEQTVTVTGKNLFDKDNPNIVRGYIAGTLFNAGTDYSVFMPCEENTTYTIQKMVAQPQTANRFRINSYDKIPAGGDSSISNLNFWNAGDGSDVTTHTYTTPAGAKYLGITVMTSNTSGTTTIDDMLASIQVEKGSATAYAPYSKQTYTINLGSIELCKLGTYQDYIWKDGEDWKVHKELGKVTINDTYYSTRYGTNNYGLTQFLVNLSYADYFDNINFTNMLTNYFTKQYTTFVNTPTEGFLPALDSSINRLRAWIRIKSTTADTEQQFKNWLNTNTPTFYYKLDTATDTTITDTTLIAQLDSLVAGGAENGTTYIKVNATDPNLPGLLYVEAPKYE